MIKINVITNNIKWIHFIKNPNSYIDRKLKKLNIRNKNFKKKYFFLHISTFWKSRNKRIKQEI